MIIDNAKAECVSLGVKLKSPISAFLALKAPPGLCLYISCWTLARPQSVGQDGDQILDWECFVKYSLITGLSVFRNM